jgi:glycosyltransferase involved in cell wall biosynthesis
MMLERLRVAHFNTLASGGAAIAARKLHDSLVKAGANSCFYHVVGDIDDPSYHRLQQRPRRRRLGSLRSRVVRSLRDRAVRPHRGQFEAFGWSTSPGVEFDLPDLSSDTIFHLHWVVGLVDYREFFATLPESQPIVWTLHDMNPLTGGCHYSAGCRRFEKRCIACPQLSHLWSLEAAARSQRLRRRALSGRNLHIVADSSWLEERARASSVLSAAKSFRTIHYGIDSSVFRPRERRDCRDRFGIDSDALVIGFGADRLDNRRKGFEILGQALSRMTSVTPFQLVTFGGRGEARAPGHISWKHIGRMTSDIDLSRLYSAFDIFVMPSLEEAFGQTALEASSCATTVIAFDCGGVSDIVRPNVNGMLVAPGDIDALARSLDELARSPERRLEYGANGRALVAREFSLELQRRRYVGLYTEISADRG